MFRIVVSYDIMYYLISNRDERVGCLRSERNDPYGHKETPVPNVHRDENS